MKKRNLRYRYLSGWKGYFSTVRYYGARGLIDYISQRSRIRSITHLPMQEISAVPARTSITHVPSYLDICKLAAEDSRILRNFREYAEYQIILDHLSRRIGDLCLNIIKDDSRILSNLEKVSGQIPGQPLVFNFSNIGMYSPTDIRYAKIVQDLDSLFSFQSQPVISEIGVGFGGQAAQTILYFEPSSYTFVDLAEVLELTKEVLSVLEHKTELNFVSPDKVKPLFSDLVISNYAFSELTKPSQDEYLENIVFNSRRGYMLYNHIHERETDSYTAREISLQIPGSIILDENPLTFQGNVLLVWGLDKPLDMERFKISNHS